MVIKLLKNQDSHFTEKMLFLSVLPFQTLRVPGFCNIHLQQSPSTLFKIEYLQCQFWEDLNNFKRSFSCVELKNFCHLVS